MMVLQVKDENKDHEFHIPIDDLFDEDNEFLIKQMPETANKNCTIYSSTLFH